MREHRAHVHARSILAVLLIGVVLLGGCSFVVMRPARPGYQPAQGPPDCIERPIIPALEGIAGGTGATLAGLAFLTEFAISSILWQDCDEDGCQGPEADHTLSARLGAASAVLLVSSVYGVMASNTCRRAYVRYRASISAAPPDPANAPIQP